MLGLGDLGHAPAHSERRWRPCRTKKGPCVRVLICEMLCKVRVPRLVSPRSRGDFQCPVWGILLGVATVLGRSGDFSRATCGNMLFTSREPSQHVAKGLVLCTPALASTLCWPRHVSRVPTKSSIQSLVSIAGHNEALCINPAIQNTILEPRRIG